MIKADFHNKKVAILGLSTEGQDSTKFFSSHGAQVFCCDRRNQQELGDLYENLTKYQVTFRLGKNYLDNLEQYDLLIRTPGMALFLPELLQAKKRGQEISSLTKIFFDFCPCPIIGVSGTKGKGTTATLISEMLKTQGFTVWLGGNVGQPLLSQVDVIKKTDLVILELSSFQLEDLHKSPHVAVVLKITQDHLQNFDLLATNYHPTKSTYIRSKTTLVRYQKPNDLAILNLDDPISKSFAKLTLAKTLYFSSYNTNADAFVEKGKVYLNLTNKKQKICSTENVKLRGLHNLENICAATLAAVFLGVETDKISDTAKSFPGLEHRLEFVCQVDGAAYFNDSFSTVPETAIAAIRSFDQPLILIAGGSEKGSDYTQLGQEIVTSKIKTLILIGQMADKIESAVRKAAKVKKTAIKFDIIKGCQNMKEVINCAHKSAQPGDVVLLSPACASFGMFKNYKQRGYLFKKYAQALLA